MVSDRSNGIYRGFIAAIVGLILIGAAELPKKDAQPEQAKEQREIADTLKDIAASLKEAQKPDQSTQPCDPKKPNRNSDLCAQWKAADAATDAAEAAWRQILIGWIGVVLGAITMAAAIAAAIFAKKAAEASEENARAAIDAVAATNQANLLAMKANARATRQAIASAGETAKALEIAERNADVVGRQLEISQESMNRQLRAYIKLIIKPNGWIVEVGKPIIFELDIVNYGQTPAHKVGFRQAIVLEKKDWTWENFDEPDRKSKNLLTSHKDHPTQTSIESDSNLTQDVFDRINMGSLCIFAKGFCFYEDVFGDEQKTVISLIVSDVELKRQRVLLAPTGNIAT